MIWSDAYLSQLDIDAEQEICGELNCLFHRFFLEITSGTSVYTLLNKVRSLLKITWRGISLEPLSWEELTLFTPSTVYVSSGTKIEASLSNPQFYALHPTNIHDIRFYPTPPESFVTSGDPYSPAVDEARCTITCWRNVDTTDVLASLPTYIARRTKKAYVLWQAFGKEGKGQDLRASDYYKKKYTFMIAQFKAINSSVFMAKKYSLSDSSLDTNVRHSRPTLPSRFERIIY